MPNTIARQTQPTTMAPHKEANNKQPPEKWALAFITQSRLCHEDWLIPPGEKVPLEDGKSYLETTLIAVQICESSSVPRVRILQPRGDFIELDKSLSDTQVDERFRSAPYLHESSVVVRSRIAPYGGSGFFAGDITGWKDYRARPLSVGSVRNLFDRSHSRYRMQDPEGEGMQAYIWSLLESEEKFGPSTSVSGATYHLAESYKTLPYPDFVHLTCEDYKVMGDKKKRNALAVPGPTDLQYSLKLRASSPVYAKQSSRVALRTVGVTPLQTKAPCAAVARSPQQVLYLLGPDELGVISSRSLHIRRCAAVDRPVVREKARASTVSFH